MPDKGWRSKGDKGIRSSPRQTGKTCGRPFSAPRKARDTTEKTTKITAKETNDSEVRILTASGLPFAYLCTRMVWTKALLND